MKDKSITHTDHSLTHCVCITPRKGYIEFSKAAELSCFLQPRLMFPLSGLLARILSSQSHKGHFYHLSWRAKFFTYQWWWQQAHWRLCQKFSADSGWGNWSWHCSQLFSPPSCSTATGGQDRHPYFSYQSSQPHSLERITALDVSAKVPDETGHLRLWVLVPFYPCLKRIGYCNSWSPSWLTLAGNMWCPLLLSHFLLLLISQWAPRGRGIRWNNQHYFTLNQSIQKVRGDNSWAKDVWKPPVWSSQPHNTSAVWNRYIDASSTAWNINAPEKNKQWLTGNVANGAGNFCPRKRISTC